MIASQNGHDVSPLLRQDCRSTFLGAMAVNLFPVHLKHFCSGTNWRAAQYLTPLSFDHVYITYDLNNSIIELLFNLPFEHSAPRPPPFAFGNLIEDP